MSIETGAAEAAAQLAALETAVNQVMSPVQMIVGVYWSRFSHDRLIFKLLVGFLALMAVADTAIACSWSWQYAVKGFTNPLLLSQWPTPMSLYILDIASVVFVTQLFFTYRVWIVSGRKSYILTTLKLILIFFNLGTMLYVLARSWWMNGLMEFVDVKHWVWAWLACGLVVDGLITISMVFYIWFRPGSKKSHEAVRSAVLSSLVVQSFQTNLVALLLQTVTLVIAITQSTSLLYAAPGLIESKVYIACVVITLNARTAVDGSGSSSRPSTSHPLHSFRPKRSANPTMSAAAVHVQVDEEVAVDGLEGEYAIDLQTVQTSVAEKGGY
ncbi:hypothetical protein JCM11251_004708 [Rhodosporidiobolus azoricus]